MRNSKNFTTSQPGPGWDSWQDQPSIHELGSVDAFTKMVTPPTDAPKVFAAPVDTS